MYIVEAPLYVASLEKIIELSTKDDGIKYEIYGAYPFSPFNGGRLNVLLDGYLPAEFSNHTEFMLKSLFGNRKEVFDSAVASFTARVEALNKQGIPFNLACTNMYFSFDEITSENMAPFELLCRLGDTCNVKNGIIINNQTLEVFLKKTYPGKFRYISSCTKYYKRDVLVNPDTAIASYINDVDQYDFVVLTPQNSQNIKILGSVIAHDPAKFMAISNVTCGQSCTSFWHFDNISKGNKIKFADLNPVELAKQVEAQAKTQGDRCQAERPADIDGFYRNLITKQINAGLRNFKIGRIFNNVESSPFDILVTLLKQNNKEVCL